MANKIQMGKLLWVFALSISIITTQAQDTPLTFIKVIQAEGLLKDEIFDKTLIWCSKTFNNSLFAIKVNERESGLIAGKASYFSQYKYYDRAKKDSITTKGWEAFLKYKFDWIIQIKEGKLRFSIENIILNETNDYPVTNSPNPPYKVLLQPKDYTARQWERSKTYFINNMEGLMEELRRDLYKKDETW